MGIYLPRCSRVINHICLGLVSCAAGELQKPCLQVPVPMRKLIRLASWFFSMREISPNVATTARNCRSNINADVCS